MTAEDVLEAIERAAVAKVPPGMFVDELLKSAFAMTSREEALQLLGTMDIREALSTFGIDGDRLSILGAAYLDGIISLLVQTVETSKSATA
jgi:hypothetical protein